MQPGWQRAPRWRTPRASVRQRRAARPGPSRAHPAQLGGSELHLDADHLAAAREDLAARLGIEARAVELGEPAAPELDVGAGPLAEPVRHGHLAEREAQLTGLELPGLQRAVRAEEREVCGRREQLGAVQQRGPQLEPSALHPHAQLAEAGEDDLLHRARHPGLLRAGVPGRVRVRIGGEGAVVPRALVEAEPRADPVVRVCQRGHLRGRRARGAGPLEGLLRGQQELRHHVPVDAAEPLVAVHRPRAAGELLELEDAREAVDRGLAVGLHQRRERGLPAHLGEHRAQVVGCGQLTGEPVAAEDVAGEHPRVARAQQRDEERASRHLLERHPVLLEEAGQGAIWVEQEARLVSAPQPAREERVEHRERLPGVEQPGAEHGDLPLEHLVERLEARGAGPELEQVVRVVEPVGSPVLAQRAVAVVDRQPQQRGRLAQVDRGARRQPLVGLAPVLLEGERERVEQRAAVAVADLLLREQVLVRHQDAPGLPQPGHSLSAAYFFLIIFTEKKLLVLSIL